MLPFLQRHSLVLALAFIAIASARIVTTYGELSLTHDEPGHVACGLEYLADHVYKLESQHPPLTRAAVALGPFLAGTRLDPAAANLFPNLPARDSEGRQALAYTGQAGRLTALARLGNLPFFWLAGLVVYAWAKRYFDAGVAVLATGLFTLLPPVLAHAGLATTDMGLCACLTAAFYALLVWAETPTWKSGVVLGLAAASAALTKFTSLAFLPCAALLTLLAYLAVRRPCTKELLVLFRSRAASFALAVTVGAFAIWAAYWFSFGPVPAWGVRLPAPEFFDGILHAIGHNSDGHANVLLGDKSSKGWWYYFPVMLSLKTPLGFLILLAPAVWPAAKRRACVRDWLPLAYSLGVLIPAMMGSINIGVRHSLPVYCGLAIVAALGLVRLLERSLTVRSPASWTAGALPLWLIVSGALYHPDYLCYFNELAPAEREKITVGSDVDWGQDIKLAARQMRAAGATEVTTNIGEWFALTPANGLPPQHPTNSQHPTAGWTIVSPTIAWQQQEIPPILEGADFEGLKKAQETPHAWWEDMTPTQRVGGLLLYYIPPDSPLFK